MEVLGIRDEGCSAPSEIGPKDIEQNQCELVRRDTREKIVVSLDELETAVPAALKAVHDGLYQKALETVRTVPGMPTTGMSLRRLPRKNPALSVLCGAETKPARTRSRMKPVSNPAVSRR